MWRSSARMRKFDRIDHTADIGFKVRGRDFPGLLKNSAAALYEAMDCERLCGAGKGVKYRMESESREDLLVGFLNELIYYSNVKNLIFKKFLITIVHLKNMYSLKIRMPDGIRARPGREVKAATYHRMKVRQTKSFLMTDLIFDV